MKLFIHSIISYKSIPQQYSYLFMIKQLLKFSLLLVTGLLCFIFFSDTPTGLQPTTLHPFQLKTSLPQIPNIDLDRLRSAQYVKFPQTTVEDIAVNRKGDIYIVAGEGPSFIYHISHKNTSIYEKIAETPGRVLGTTLNKEQDLFAFADQLLGLRILNLKTNQMETVATQFENKKFESINSVTFGKQPHLLYFTHSCGFSMKEYHLELLYKTGTGKVFELNLKTKKIRKMLDGLQFINGIAYSEKQNCLYANQINLYRVIRIPLEQSQSQKYTVVIDNLIGYPDNLKITEDGKLWIACPSLRDPVNVFIDNHPIIRKAIINLRIPQDLFEKFANISFSGGLKIDPQTGQIVDYFFGKSNQISFVTGIVEKNHKIYMSSIKNNVIAIVDYL